MQLLTLFIIHILLLNSQVKPNDIFTNPEEKTLLENFGNNLERIYEMYAKRAPMRFGKRGWFLSELSSEKRAPTRFGKRKSSENEDGMIENIDKRAPMRFGR